MTTQRTKALIVSCSVLAAAFAAVPHAQALCGQNLANLSTADCDAWLAMSTNMPATCEAGDGGWTAEWTDWTVAAYALDGNEWAGRGWDQSNNVLLEFPKFWHTARMLSEMRFGSRDPNAWMGLPPGLPITPSWHHPTDDYQPASEAADNAFHGAMRYSVADTCPGGPAIACNAVSATPAVITSTCFWYDGVSNVGNDVYNTPIVRAADMLHEAWHSWQTQEGYSEGTATGHIGANTTECVNGVNSCDWFYPHTTSAYAPGEMYQHDMTENRFHSPFQVQIEYICDMVDNPNPWIPASAILVATNAAATFSTNFIMNGIGVFCGTNRPF